MSVLSKSGCNAGKCHGNASGKGGLALSLRGQDPLRDFLTLTRGLQGRRVNVLEPEHSLMLLKPTMRLAHEGGRRFDRKSKQYDILRRWIAGGAKRGQKKDAAKLVRLEVTPRRRVVLAPGRSVQITAKAIFSDGQTRDVSDMAVYETSGTGVDVSPAGLATRRSYGETTVVVRYLNKQRPVRLAFVPQRPTFTAKMPEPANYIDRFVFDQLKRLRINPSPPADDHTFVRRAYLDVLGIPPTAAEARRFVADTRTDKRRRLIDRLLARPEFADHWALKWSDLLRNEEKTLDAKGVELYHGWIRRAIAQGKPMDQFVRELVGARGSTYKNPPANYYRALRTPIARAESTAQLFLGVRLGCAKCHNHPFDRWTQDDYYRWVAWFARVEYKIVDNKRKDKNDKHEFAGEQIVKIAAKGEVTNPGTGAPAAPKVLGETAKQPGAKGDRLTRLSRWVTSANNSRFAEAQANRVWQQLMGRGIVDPIDDFRATNPASHPDLLAALARDFTESGFDLRAIIRRITSSRTYQLASTTNETNLDDEINYSHALVRRLPAEQLLDSINQLLDVRATFYGYKPGLRAGQLPGVRSLKTRRSRPTPADRFLKAFGKPPRLITCECERSTTSTLSHALQLIGGEYLDGALARDDNRLAALARDDRPASVIVDELFWSALGRPANALEQKASIAILQQGDKRSALQDLAWALINTKEFLFRH